MDHIQARSDTEILSRTTHPYCTLPVVIILHQHKIFFMLKTLLTFTELRFSSLDSVLTAAPSKNHIVLTDLQCFRGKQRQQMFRVSYRISRAVWDLQTGC